MTVRTLTVIVLAASACHDVPFLSRHATSSTTGKADGGLSDHEQDRHRGLDEASSGNLAEGIAIADAGPANFSIPVPWAFDGGTDSDELPFIVPSPTSLPSASASFQSLALAEPSRSEVGAEGCGEPPTCYLRMVIATARGHVYAASMSKAYPNDSCVTKTIESDGAVLVGDSHARFADLSCEVGSPQVTLGFLLPQRLLYSWQAGQLWESTSGFRSEWSLVDAGDDSGIYEPIPGLVSKLWPAWARVVVGGEIYGELLVPLRHTVKHSLAIGFALFDIRVRR
jgi:hypothetical protein